MKAIVLLIAGLLLAGGLFWWWRNYQSVYYPVKSGAVVFFGDSLVAGVGATPGNDLPALLSERLGIEIINAGLSGATTKSGLDRLDQDVLAHNPQLVLIILGGNDALQKVPAVATRENLAATIDKIKLSGAQVVLIGIQGSLLGDAYRNMYKELAQEKKINHLPNILKNIIGNPSLMFDAIHPNDAGYEQMADRIEPLIKKLLAGK